MPAASEGEEELLRDSRLTVSSLKLKKSSGLNIEKSETNDGQARTILLGSVDQLV
jgi:hypothetical protein